MNFGQNIKYIDPPRRLERRALHVLFVVLVLFLLESLGGTYARAENVAAAASPSPGSEPPPTRPASELAKNFGVVYAAQWTVYLVTQQETIEEHGSWENFFSYPLRPDFDKDSFDYNILKHALSGNYYYLFYRSRGYDEVESFGWTFMSSLAFEFAVETYTEQPSYQDIYQTPIYGTLLGMGAERIGNYLFSSDSKIVRAFGYIFNPFELIKVKKDNEVVAFPAIEKETLGFNVSWRF